MSQLKFNPTNPSILYASFRRSTSIYSWDLRGNTSIPLQVFQASACSPGEVSNQKLMFDIDYAGKWLGVGDHVRLQTFASISSRVTCDISERRRAHP